MFVKNTFLWPLFIAMTQKQSSVLCSKNRWRRHVSYCYTDSFNFAKNYMTDMNWLLESCKFIVCCSMINQTHLWSFNGGLMFHLSQCRGYLILRAVCNFEVYNTPDKSFRFDQWYLIPWSLSVQLLHCVYVFVQGTNFFVHLPNGSWMLEFYQPLDRLPSDFFGWWV